MCLLLGSGGEESERDRGRERPPMARAEVEAEAWLEKKVWREKNDRGGGESPLTIYRTTIRVSSRALPRAERRSIEEDSQSQYETPPKIGNPISTHDIAMSPHFPLRQA